jgi:predicted nucleotidyltransferase
VAKIRGVLATFPAVERAVLYGSRAMGNFKPGSDIDLTLHGDDLTARMLGDIAEALDDLPSLQKSTFLPFLWSMLQISL